MSTNDLHSFAGRCVKISTASGVTVTGTLTLVEEARYVLVTTAAASGSGTYTGPVQIATIATIEEV